MNDIVKTLFLDDPYLAGQVYASYDQLPEFREAERTYEDPANALRQRLGGYDAFEEALDWHLAQYAPTPIISLDWGSVKMYFPPWTRRTKTPAGSPPAAGSWGRRRWWSRIGPASRRGRAEGLRSPSRRTGA